MKRLLFWLYFGVALFIASFVLSSPAQAAEGDYVDRWSTGFPTINGWGAYSLFWDGSDIWIINRGNDTLHKFTADGTEDTDATITFTEDNANAEGIAWDGSSFWIVDSVDELVYEYDADGNYQSTFDISNEVGGAPRGIVWDGTYFWISDYDTDEVYRYNSDGEYTNHSWDTASIGNGNPVDLTWDGNYFWVVDYLDEQIYQYNASGTYQSRWSVNADNDGLRGITLNGEYFFVSDLTDGYVYRYDRGTDSTAPTIQSVSSDTADGTYGVGSVIDIDITFSEPVNASSAVTVTLETGDTDRTCSFTVSNAQSASCNYTVQEGDTSSDLDVSSISGTISDLSGNAMTNFTPSTTLAANKAIVIEGVSPTISTLSPADNATNVGVGDNLVLTFSEAVDSESGNITIHQASDGSVVQTIDVTSEYVTGSGSTTITINPASNLEYSTEYYVQIAETAFDDAVGNSFAGITDTTTWSFTTVNTTSSSSNNSSDSTSSSSSVAQTCTATKPSGIPDLFQIDTQETTATLYFTPISDTSTYYISYSTQPSAEEHGVELELGSEGVQNFTVKALSPGTQYYFKVRGQNGCKAGDWSSIYSMSTASSTGIGGLPLLSKANDQANNTNPFKDKLEIVSSELSAKESTKSAEIQDEQQGVELDVVVKDNNEQPLGGVDVTLHSKVQHAVTDESGVARFKNVEPGDHRVILAYNEYEGEQELYVDGSRKQQELTIQVNLKPGVSVITFAITVGLLSILILILLIVILKSRRKRSSNQ